MEKIPIEKYQEIMKIVHQDIKVGKLIAIDPKAEIYIHTLSSSDCEQINQEFPNFLPISEIVYSINIITHQMSRESGYQKIRLYMDSSFHILRRLEN